MKWSLLLLIIINTIYAHAQFSVSGGMQIQTNKKIKSTSLESVKSNVNVHLSSTLNMDYQVKTFRFGIGLRLTNKTFELKQHYTCEDWWQHGKFQEIEYTNRYADINYSYLGINLSVSLLFVDHKNYQFGVGIFTQFDFKIREEERNHLKTKRLNEKGPQGNWDENVYYNITTHYPNNYEAFDMMTVTPFIPTTGLVFKNRFLLNHFHLDLALSIGYDNTTRMKHNTIPRSNCSNSHYQTIATYNNYSAIFRRFNASLGYRF